MSPPNVESYRPGVGGSPLLRKSVCNTARWIARTDRELTSLVIVDYKDCHEDGLQDSTGENGGKPDAGG